MAGAVFAEVNCNDERALCNAHGAGTGGWPLIKHWSAAHPYTSDPDTSGQRYPRTKEGAVCDEIVSEGRLAGYVSGVLAEAAAVGQTSSASDKSEL